jgi:hypothetical protein
VRCAPQSSISRAVMLIVPSLSAKRLLCDGRDRNMGRRFIWEKSDPVIDGYRRSCYPACQVGACGTASFGIFQRPTSVVCVTTVAAALMAFKHGDEGGREALTHDLSIEHSHARGQVKGD